MTRCVKMVLLLGCGFLAGRAAFADDASLQRAFANLASDDPAVRDAAVDAIVKEGGAAEALVKARLAMEKDPESRARLETVLQRIRDEALLARRWEPVWSAEPLPRMAYRAVLSPDGKLLATGGVDGHVRILDAATFEILRDFDAEAPVLSNGLAFDRASRLVFIARDWISPRVLAFCIADGKPLGGVTPDREFQGLEYWKGPAGEKAVYAPDSDFGGAGGFVAIDSRTGWVSGSSVEYSLREDGHLVWLFNSGRTGPGPSHLEVRELDLLSSKEPQCRVIDLDEDPPRYGEFAASRDLREVAFVRENRCHIADISTGAERATIGEEVVAVGAARDGWILVGKDGSIQSWKGGKRDWSVDTGRADFLGFTVMDALIAIPIASARPADDFPLGLELRSSKDGSVAASFPNAKLRGPWGADTFAVSLPSGESAVFSGGRDLGRFRTPLWCAEEWSNAQARGSSLLVMTDAGPGLVDLATGQSRGVAPLQHDRIERLEWCEEGLFARGFKEEAFFAGGGKEFRRYPADKREPGTGRAPEGALLERRASLTGTADGRLTAWAESHTVHVRRVKEGGEEAIDLTVEGESVETDVAVVQRLAFSPDGLRVAIGNGDAKCVEVWDLDARRRIFAIPADPRTVDGPVFLANETLAILLHAKPESHALVLYDAEGHEARRFGWTDQLPFAGRLVTGYSPGGYRCLDLLDPKQDVLFEDLHDLDRSAPSLRPVLADATRGLILARADGVQGEDTGVRAFRMPTASSTPAGEIRFADETAAASLPDGSALLLTTRGVAILRPLDWAPVGVNAEIQGSALAVSPDGKRVAIAKGPRVTVYERR